MTRPTYRFGDCRIDPSTRELHQRGELVTLSPKVFDCLAYLIEHRDRAVGRDELIAAVWGRSEVSDTLLGQTVLKARRAVGDDGNEQHAIRTIPRFGYRWIAALEVEVEVAPVPGVDTPPVPALSATDTDAPDAPLPPAPTPASPTTPRAATPRRRSRALAAALLAAMLVLALGIWRLGHPPQPAPTPAAGASAPGALLAVLPVETAVPAEEWSWLRLGLMDLIATRLRGAGLAVVPSDNVVALVRGKEATTASAVVSAGSHAQALVIPVVTRVASGWNVRLTLHRQGSAGHQVEAHATDVVVAARTATDLLLAYLGKRAGDAGGADLPLDELLSRVDAALLTDDLDGARERIEHASAALRRLPELRLRLAQIAFRGGHLDDAATRLQALLGEVGAEANPVLRARILNGIGATDILSRRAPAAEQAFGEAIQLLENRNQPAALGQAYTGLAISRAAQGRFDAAQKDFSRARIALELAGDGLALARVEENEGIVAAKRGHYVEALAAHRRAAQRFERFGALNEQAITLANTASAQLALLQAADALVTLRSAQPLLNRLENRGAHQLLQLEQAAALIHEGQLQAAQSLLQALTDADDPTIAARADFERAQLAFGRGDYSAATRLAGTATQALDGLDERRERSQAWLLLTRSLRAQGKLAEASDETNRFSAWAREQSVQPMATLAALARAEQAWAEHDPARAGEAYEQALAQAARDEVPAVSADVVVSYGNRLIAAGELERASSVVGQASHWADHDFGCALLLLRYYHALGQIDPWRNALQRAQTLAGERPIAGALTQPPHSAGQPKP